MTAPLTPQDCDLRDFQFMPLDVRRLRDSDLAALESAEACWAAVLLWGASWHQVPAASLPDDDRVLAQLAGYGRVVGEWLKVRDGALRAFIKCDDRRLYHPVVAEKAIEAWRGKLEQRWRTELARIKKHNQRTGADDPSPTFEEYCAALAPGARLAVPRDNSGHTEAGDDAQTLSTTPNPPKTVENTASRGTPRDVPRDKNECPEGQAALSPPCPQGNGIQGTGRGTGTHSVSDETGEKPPSDDLDELRELPLAKRCWRLAVKVLTERGGLTDPKARAFIGKLKGGGLSDDDLWRIAESAWVAGTQDPQPYFVAGAERAGENRGGIIRPSPERQRAWMAEFNEKPNWWNAGERGPRPGNEGCQVAADIQREFGVEPFSPRGAPPPEPRLH